MSRVHTTDTADTPFWITGGDPNAFLPALCRSFGPRLGFWGSSLKFDGTAIVHLECRKYGHRSHACRWSVPALERGHLAYSVSSSRGCLGEVDKSTDPRRSRTPHTRRRRSSEREFVLLELPNSTTRKPTFNRSVLAVGLVAQVFCALACARKSRTFHCRLGFSRRFEQRSVN